MKKIAKDNRGFTVIETMIALSFFAIAMLGAGALYLRANETNKNGNVISSANFLAKTTLEEYKNMSLSQLDATINPSPKTDIDINEYGNAGGIFTRVVTLSSIDSGNARQIEIRVTWPNVKFANKGGALDRIVLTTNVRGVSGL